MPSDSQASQAYVDGLSLMRQFDNAHAISRLKQSIAIDPQFALSHAALATALSAVGIPKQAAEEADRAAALDTNLSHETQLEVLAQAQGIHNNFAGEQQTYQQLVDLHPANLANRFLLAHASMDAGHSRDALAMLNQLRATNKDAVNDPSISSAFADVYATLGDYPNSLASAQKAADQAKARGAQILYGRILCTVAQANLHLNRLPSAEQEAIQSLSISREFHDYSAEFRALNRLGQIYTAMNRMNDAENVLQQALDRERALGEQDRQVHTLSALGVIASGQGDHARALDYFTQQYQAAVTSGRKKFQLTAEYHLAEEHALVGDLPRAQREIAQVIATAVSLGDKETERYAILESAKIFLQQKKPDDGLRIIQAGLPSASGSADWLAQFSDMQARLWIMKGNAGSASDSIAAEQKSLQPGSPQDQARLQQTKLLLANISTSQNVQGHPK
jgi:tetratricopeptide (TPR) repeat protein